MKNYFKYEFKKNLASILISTAIFAIILAIYLISAKFIYLRPEYINGEYTSEYVRVARNSPIIMITVFAYTMVFLVTIKNFSFKMKKTAVDVYYQLPLKKRNLYLIKYLVGILEILIPFTVCVLLSAVIISMKDNVFVMKYLFLYYLAAIPYLIIMFTIISFLFIKGNTIIDGTINVAMYIAVSLLIPSTIYSISNIINPVIYFSTGYFSIVSPVASVTGVFNSLFENNFNGIETEFVVSLILNAIFGIAAFILLFFNEDKAEDVSQITESYFSYKVLLPTLIFLVSFNITANIGFDATLIFILAAAYIGYVIYRRHFKITKYDIISIASSFIASVAFGIILYEIIQ